MTYSATYSMTRTDQELLAYANLFAAMSDREFKSRVKDFGKMSMTAKAAYKRELDKRMGR